MILSLRKTNILLAASAAFGVLFWNGATDIERGLVSASEARVGRPLTPMSYAGVARRTVRRGAYVAGAAAATGAAVAYGSQCYQTVDAYGRVYTRC